MKKTTNRILVILFSLILAALCILLLFLLRKPGQADPENQSFRKPKHANITMPTEADSPVHQVAMNDYLSPYYRSPDDPAPYAVAALYEDGTVRVACHENDRAMYASVASWKNIRKIWMRNTTIFGLDAAGKLHTTGNFETRNLTGVTDLLFADSGVFALLEDGTVRCISPSGLGETPIPDALQGKPVVKVLPYSNVYDWGSLILYRNGTIASTDTFGYMRQLEGLGNVRDIFVFRQTPAAVQEDGTLMLPDGPDPNLTGAVKLVSAYSGMLFAVTGEGEVKYSGKVNPMIADTLASMPKTGALDIADMDGMRADHVVILYDNGTVYSPTPALNEVVKNWKDIVQLNWYEDYDFMVLYGLRKDGTVIAATMDFGCNGAEVTEHYKGWKLNSLHVKPFSGAIGITVDGNVVGDYAFEYVDLSGL